MIGRLLPGAATLAVIGGIVGGAFLGLLLAAGDLSPGDAWGEPYIRRVVLFTIGQALLSTLLSVGLAIPVARALARRQAFPGRDVLLRLFSLPLVMPTLVAILGIVAIYGKSGLLNRAGALFGLPAGQYLYGLTGILIGHVFFNLPLAVRLLLPLWQAIPGETWRLAGQLGMGSRELFRLIELPLLRQVVPEVAGLVFMLCFTSFAVVLTLGGGPAASTIEVAIYQAVRFDFDLVRAVELALLQIGLCALLVGIGLRFVRHAPLSPSLARAQDRPDLDAPLGRIIDATVLILAALFVLLPVLAVLVSGVAGPLTAVLGDGALWAALLRSLIVALAAGLLSLALGCGLLLASRELRVRLWRPRGALLLETTASLVLVVPPLVIGTGLFVLLARFTDVLAIGLVLVVLVNALMALPYVIRTLGPPMMRVAERYDRLSASLGIAGRHRLRLVEWPLLRRPAGAALALASALAVGDLGVIALFGTQDSATLPLLLYGRIAAYQLDAAAVTALVLLGLCLGLFVAIERGVGGRA